VGSPNDDAVVGTVGSSSGSGSSSSSGSSGGGIDSATDELMSLRGGDGERGEGGGVAADPVHGRATNITI